MRQISAFSLVLLICSGAAHDEMNKDVSTLAAFLLAGSPGMSRPALKAARSSMSPIMQNADVEEYGADWKIPTEEELEALADDQECKKLLEKIFPGGVDNTKMNEEGNDEEDIEEIKMLEAELSGDDAEFDEDSDDDDDDFDDSADAKAKRSVVEEMPDEDIEEIMVLEEAMALLEDEDMVELFRQYLEAEAQQKQAKQDRLQELISRYGKHEKDVGGSAVQVALISDRIRDLTQHLKVQRKDFAASRRVVQLAQQRRTHLKYLIQSKKFDVVDRLIEDFGIRVGNIKSAVTLQGARARRDKASRS